MVNRIGDLMIATEVLNILRQQNFPVEQWLDASFDSWNNFLECVEYLVNRGYSKEMLISDLQHLPQYIYLPKLSEDGFIPKLKATINHNSIQVPLYLGLCK